MRHIVTLLILVLVLPALGEPLWCLPTGTRLRFEVSRPAEELVKVLRITHPKVAFEACSPGPPRFPGYERYEVLIPDYNFMRWLDPLCVPELSSRQSPERWIEYSFLATGEYEDLLSVRESLVKLQATEPEPFDFSLFPAIVDPAELSEIAATLDPLVSEVTFVVEAGVCAIVARGRPEKLGQIREYLDGGARSFRSVNPNLVLWDRYPAAGPPLPVPIWSTRIPKVKEGESYLIIHASACHPDEDQRSK